MYPLHKLFPTVFLITAVCFGFQAKDTTPSVQTPTIEKNAATVEQFEGLYIFTDSRPQRKYKYLGSVKATFSMSGQYHAVRKILANKVRKEYPNAEGLIIHANNGGQDVGDAIIFE